jgi:hypothetical protein
MAKSNVFENDLLKLIFNGGTIANLAQNATVSPLTGLYFALHTADPGEAGDQSTFEVVYPSYIRASVARTSAAFLVSGNSVSLVFDLDFPASSGGATTTAPFFSVGTDASGPGKILYRGTVSAALVINPGNTPRLLSGSNITEE